MGYRYSTGDRTFGGSMDRRLNPRIVSTELNTKIGSQHLPDPMVRSTETKCVPEQDAGRKARIGIPERFRR
jgi:hypothetical protein